MASYLTGFRFTKQGTTGPQTIGGLGFRPKLLIAWSTRLTTTGPTDGAQLLEAMTDGTNQVCNFIRHPDNEAATTSAQTQRLDRFVYAVTATSGGTPTVEVEGQVTAFTDDGFTINWIVNDGAASIFHCVAVGGDDVEVDFQGVTIDMALNGTKAVSHTLSGTPDCFVCIGQTEGGSYNLGAPYGSIRGFGFSDGSANLTGWTLGRGTGGAADTYAGQHTDRFATVRVANLSGAADLSSIQITAKDASTYTVTRVFAASATPIQYIFAIRGVQFALGTVSTPASAGSATLTLGLRPDLILLQTHGQTTTTANAMGLSMGMWSRSTGVSGGVWIGGTDGASPSVYARDHYEDVALRHRTPTASGASSPEALAVSVASITTTTASLSFSSVPASAVSLLYIAISTTTSGSSSPLSYEDPCAMQDVRLFATVKTADELIKVGVSPLRDPAALGGFAEPRLLDVSDMVRVASDPVSGAWSAQTATMRWADTDRANRARSQTRTSFRGCTASIYATSTANRRALGAPRLLFSGLVNSDTADEHLVFTAEINDLIGNDYALFSEEKQIPQREVGVAHFPNAPSDALGRGEPIVGGRVAPLNPLTAEGVLDTIYCGPIVVNGTFTTPDATTVDALVAALQASADAGTLDNDWGNILGHGDCRAYEHGTIPTTEAGLKAAFGSGDIDAALNQTAVTGGDTLLACMVAGHAITEVLDGANGNPSVWIDDTQLDPAQLGVSWWCPQIPGDTTWATAFGSDKFTDILGTDGTTRRYTLVLVDPASEYGTQLQNGSRLHLDCIGLETVGDGTGTAITDFYALYKHVLINFILQSYLTGAWLTVPQFLFTDNTTYLDRVDESSFNIASAIAGLSISGGRLGSFKIGDRTSVREVIATFNLSGACLLGQDDYQRLFVRVIDTRRTQFLNGHRTLRDKVDFIGSFVVEGRPDWQANWIQPQYARNYYTNTDERGAGGGGVAPVQDTTSQARDGVFKKTLQLAYVRDDATALNVANYYLSLLKDLPRVARYTRRGPCGLEDDILDGVPITHYNGYGSNGAVDRAFLILSKTVSKYAVASFVALDVEELLS